MKASVLAFDSHFHIPFLNYFCFRNSGENGGERDLRGSPRDCRYDSVISVIPVIPVVWVVLFVPNSLVSPTRARLSACFNCKYFPTCTHELVLHVRCLLGTGRNPCTGKTEERKIHDRGNEIIYFVGDSFEFCSSFSVLKKCNGIWDASYLGEEANLKNMQSNSFSAKKFVLSMYICKYVTFVLWMLMKAS